MAGVSGAQTSNLTAEFKDGALYIYDSANVAVLIVSSTGFDVRGGGVTISTATVTTSFLNACSISTGTITSAAFNAGTISTSNISTSVLSASSISTSTISAGALSVCTISTSTVTTSVLSGSSISTSTISVGSLSACVISTGSITTAAISAGTISSSVLHAVTNYGQQIRTLVGDTTLTISTSGEEVRVTASDVIVTLPGCGSSGIALRYKIVSNATAAVAQVVVKTTTTELIKGGFVNSTGSSIAANTGATHAVGDYICVLGNPATTSWTVTEMVGTWVTTT